MKKNRIVQVICLFALISVLLVPVYAAPKVTLTVWAQDPATDSPDPSHTYTRELAKNFQAKNPDIKLDWVSTGSQGSALNNRLKVAMANDQGPDIFQSWGGSFMNQFVDAGKLLDLTKELKNIQTSSAAREAMSYKGKIYGVAPFFGVIGMFVNEGIFKEYGLTVPTTIDELETVCETLKAKGIQPITVGARDQWPALHPYMYLVNRYGGNVFMDAANRKVRFDSEPFVQAAEKFQEWSKKGYLGDKPLSEAYGDAQLAMTSGRAAIHITGSWLCGMYSDPKQTKQTIGYYAFPVLKGGKGLVTDVMGMTDIGYVASKTGAKKKDAIVRFMKYAMSVEAGGFEPGRVSTVPGVKAPTRATGMAYNNIMAKAKTVQFFWDQNLPATVSTPVNTTIQTFLQPETDVKKSLTKFEELVEENMSPVKK
jgi:raffinose/stachyose/melibiose transport system substrate-binding protein